MTAKEENDSVAGFVQPAAAPRVAKRRGVGDTLALYLPLLLMVGLALASYWLVQNAPDVKLDKPMRTETPQTVDYFMQDYGMRHYNEVGALSKTLTGARLEVLSADKNQKAYDVTYEAQTSKGDWVVATAEQGGRSADGEQVTLEKNVQVRHYSSDKEQLYTDVRGQWVLFDNPSQKIKLKKGVTMMRGNDRVSAQAGVLDLEKKRLNLTGGVRASIRAK